MMFLYDKDGVQYSEFRELVRDWNQLAPGPNNELDTEDPRFASLSSGAPGPTEWSHPFLQAPRRRPGST